MAKMFYSLGEAAQKLGVSENEIKEMAVAGKLQQFRDRDKLMFKRDQIDALAEGDKDGTAEMIPLAGDSAGATGLSETGTVAGSSIGEEDTSQATGMSVFDAGEVEPADPLAQTQVTAGIAEESELSLESVGSGSGLLDLTRESDDTSLGAELLDEIYPGGEGSDVKVGSGVGISGVFESGAGLGGSAIGEVVSTGEMTAVGGPVYADEVDPAASGLGVGMLFGASVALFIGLAVALANVMGSYSAVAAKMADKTDTLVIWTVGLLVGSIVLGLVGMFIGKSRG